MTVEFQTAAWNKSSQVNDYSFYPLYFSWFFAIEISEVISTKIMGNNTVLKLVKKGCVVSPTAIPYLCSFFRVLK